jgi:hypothetical protein
MIPVKTLYDPHQVVMSLFDAGHGQLRASEGDFGWHLV